MAGPDALTQALCAITGGWEKWCQGDSGAAGNLQHEAASPDFYKESAEHIHGVLARIDEIARELETALARWMELEEIARRT